MSTQLRARRFVLSHGRLIAILLVAVGVLAMAGGGYVYATPGSETVTERVDVQSVSTEITPSARVTRSNALYDRGQRLVDPSAYLFSATPIVDLEVVTRVPSGTGVSVDQRLTLELSASNNNQVFWSDVTLLAADSGQVSDGEAELAASVNMSALRERTSDTREALGDVGVLTSELNLTVAYDTGTYQGELSVSSPIVLTSSAYWFEQELTASSEHSNTVSRTVQVEPDLATVAGLEAVGLLALVGAGAIVLFQRREGDIDTIDTALAHERYEEWISDGEFPTQTDKKYVHINSLEDLVDVAIDSNKRVLHDAELETYVVVDSDLIYYHTTDRSLLDAWLDL